MKTILFIILVFFQVHYSNAQENSTQKHAFLVMQADSLFNLNDYVNALELYEDAYSISKNEDLEQKIDYTKKYISAEEEFNKSVKAGDSLFLNKEYTEARIMYIRAICIKSHEYEVQNKVLQIDKILKKED